MMFATAASVIGHIEGGRVRALAVTTLKRTQVLPDLPTMDEAAKIYCDKAGRKDVPDLNWYYCYNLFRLTGILQGIAGRVRDGTASSAKAMESAKRTVPLAQASWKYAQLAGAK